MKKRLFSLFLSACLLLSMLPAQALALLDGSPLDKRETDQARYQIPGSGTVAEASFEKAWNAIAEAGRGGTVTLTRNVTAKDGSFGSGKGFDAGGRINLPRGEVTIDLAGHTIDRGLAGAAAREGGGVLYVGSGAVLTLTDSKGGGKITGGNTTASGGGAFAAGKLALDGVTISGNKAAVSGGGVYNAGTVSAKGVVTITGNTAGGKANNVFLSAGRTVAVPAGLGNGARIGVTTASAPQPGAPVTAASGQLTETDTKRFTSDAGLETALVNGQVVLRLASDPVKGSEPEPVQAPQNAAAQADGPDIVVTLNPMGGTVSTVSSLKINYPASQENYTGLPASPQKDGYTFGGWYREQDCSGAEVKNGDAITPRSAHTLYASWQAIAQATAEGDEAEYSKDGATVTGTFAAMWNKAATDGGTVKLLQGVTATDGSFGTGAGFSGDITVTDTMHKDHIYAGGFILVPNGQTITLDLNGHTINRGLSKAQPYGHVIHVGNVNLSDQETGSTATLILEDSGSTGTITGGNAGGNSGLDAGASIENATMDFGGGVYIAQNGNFTMNGGTITGNHASVGGGIHAFGSCVINNGKIKDNKASITGGGINAPAGQPLTLNGGEITGNTTTLALSGQGAGVFVSNLKTVYISGNPKIHGNYWTPPKDTPKEENIYLTYALDGTNNDAVLTLTGELGADADIRITTARKFEGSTTKITVGVGDGTYNPSEDDKAKFMSDVGYPVSLKGEGTDTPTIIFGKADKSYTVTYHWNDGTGKTEKQTYTDGDTLALIADTPTREGYTFDGWFSNDGYIADGDTEITDASSIDVKSNMDLFAHWTPNTYKITYDANTGTGTMTADTAKHGEAFTLPECGFTAPTGKEFDCWAIGSKDTGTKVKAGDTHLFEADTIVYATWKDNATTPDTFTVTYHWNDGSDPEHTDTQTYPLEDGGNNLTFITEPTREGYTFEGWYNAATGGTKVEEGTAVTKNMDLYAHWEAKTYTITYNANGGTGDMPKGTATHGEEFTLPKCGFTPPEDKEFDRWAIGSETGTKVEAEKTYLFTADTTVYAIWKDVETPPEKETFKITLDANGGTIGGQPTKTINVEKDNPYGDLGTPVREGFDFIGWFTEEDGGEQVKSTDIPTGDTTLYAHWTKGEEPPTPDAEARWIYTDNSDKTVTEDGTFEDMWNNAMGLSRASTVMLLKDITATNGSFGRGDGFSDSGFVLVPDVAAITLDLNGKTLSRNLDTPQQNGHVIEIEQGAIFTLTDTSEAQTGMLTGGNTTDTGGGILHRGDEFYFRGGKITGNKAEKNGGGVYHDGKTFLMTGGEISGNNATSTGGGVHHLSGTFQMTGGKISGNNATDGGGVYQGGDTFKMEGGEITENTATLGGGVYHYVGSFQMEDGKIFENNAKNGGGVYHDRDTFQMTGGEITGNNAAENGGGVYHDNDVFRMAGGKISGNNTDGNGGGVYHANGQFTVEDNGEISGNTAKNGGGIYARSSTGIKKSDASIHDNTATGNGGGIYLAHGQLDMEGGKITGNSAKLGGGVYYGGEKEGDQPTFRVAGTVEVSGNQGGNVYLTDGMLINNKTGYLLEDASKIWVTTEIKPAEGAPVTIAKPFKDDENKSAVFKSDEPYQVQWDDAKKEVQLVVPNKFVVEYDPNDGTLPDDEKYQYYDKAGTETIKDMPEPSREGYTFLGWFTEADGGEKITEEDNVPVKSNMTLYAHWEEIVETFKVTYDANGGSGTMRGHTEVLPDEEITLKQNGFTAPSGMEFNYWAVGSTSGEQKKPGDKITVAKDTTVYAIWKTKSNPPEPSKPSRPSGGGSSGGGSSSSSTLTITSSAGTGGSISPKGRVEVKRGSDKTYTITAQSGYVISDVLVDGKSVGARSSYTFEDIRRSHTIKAVFTKSAQQTQQPAQPAVTTPSTTTAGSCPRDASCPIAPFNDAQPTAWYHDGVHACIANGLMTGTGNGHFEPSTPLSRGMLAQILYNREGKPAVGGGSTFPDVPAGAWYENAVKRASATGLVAGYENGSYGPGDAVTREQLVVILWRHAGSPVPINSTPFSDFNDTREYARDAVRWAYGSSIISGKEGNRFDPSGRASRAEVAQMLKNYFML